MDARGQTAIGHQEVSPNRFLLCCAAYHAGSVCTYLFPPPPFTNARCLIFTEIPSRLKVFLPEVRARGRVGIERERKV